MKIHIPQSMSLVDLRQIAMMQGKYIFNHHNTYNYQEVYKISNTNGLYTIDELKKLFLH